LALTNMFMNAGLSAAAPGSSPGHGLSRVREKKDAR
jgi:hypothetical protein